MLTTIQPLQMQELEQKWMQEHSIPSIILMEEAARGIIHAIHRHASEGSAVLFLCGPGANGGDGYAAARQWKCHGGKSIIWELTETKHPDARIMRTLAQENGVEIFRLSSSEPLPPCALVVDALFGTGLSRALEDPLPKLFQQIQSLGKPVIAADIPSGLSGENGEVLGCVLPAVETVAFHRPKTGFYLASGPSCTGTVTVHPIFIAQEYGSCPGLSVLQRQDIPRLLVPRSPQSHKGTYGHVVIFAGSPGMAGAGIMCARAAIKAGAGLTTVLCCRELLPVFQSAVPSAMCVTLPEDDHHTFSSEAVPVCRTLLEKATCAVIGCGMGTQEALLPILKAFIAAPCPVIFDADALTLLSRHPELTLPDTALITPHPGEAARLLHRTTEEVLRAPLEALDALYGQYGCAVILKNACSLMRTHQGTAVHPFPSPALARGGSGDMLCGFLAALISRCHESIPTLASMQCAVFLHAQAGVSAARDLGEDCATCGDILDHFRISIS